MVFISPARNASFDGAKSISILGCKSIDRPLGVCLVHMEEPDDERTRTGLESTISQCFISQLEKNEELRY